LGEKEVMKKSNIIATILVILFMAGVYYLDKTACNPKGTVSSKINWSGRKTCE
jgi:hypothetical protein